jgi:hypothetical protein
MVVNEDPESEQNTSSLLEYMEDCETELCKNQRERDVLVLTTNCLNAVPAFKQFVVNTNTSL